jgi:hypothetical protein
MQTLPSKLAHPNLDTEDRTLLLQKVFKQFPSNQNDAIPSQTTESTTQLVKQFLALTWQYGKNEFFQIVLAKCIELKIEPNQAFYEEANRNKNSQNEDWNENNSLYLEKLFFKEKQKTALNDFFDFEKNSLLLLVFTYCVDEDIKKVITYFHEEGMQIPLTKVTSILKTRNFHSIIKLLSVENQDAAIKAAMVKTKQTIIAKVEELITKAKSTRSDPFEVARLIKQVFAYAKKYPNLQKDIIYALFKEKFKSDVPNVFGTTKRIRLPQLIIQYAHIDLFNELIDSFSKDNLFELAVKQPDNNNDYWNGLFTSVVSHDGYLKVIAILKKLDDRAYEACAITTTTIYTSPLKVTIANETILHRLAYVYPMYLESALEILGEETECVRGNETNVSKR